MYNDNKCLDRSSGTVTLNGVILCGERADSAVLLRYSWQFAGRYKINNGNYQSSGTGAFNGVHLCSVWARVQIFEIKPAVFCCCTVTATGWIRSQVLVHLKVFFCVVFGRKVQFCCDKAGGFLVVDSNDILLDHK